MKKKLLCLLMLVCFGLTSCNNVPIENPNEKENVEITDVNLHEITVDHSDAELIDTSSLYYTEAVGIRTYPEFLPSVCRFQYPYVYYTRMTSGVYGSSDNDPIRIYIGRYNVVTQEKTEIARGRFTSFAAKDGMLLVDENCIIFIFFRLGDDGAKTTIEMYDFQNGSYEVLAELPAYNFFGWAKKLSDNELVFLLYESIPEGTREVLLLYNMQTDTMNEIYRGEKIGGYREGETSTKDIFAIDTENGEICLLMQQYVQDGLDHYMRKIDRYGNVLSEEKIEVLSIFDTPDNEAETLVIEGNYSVIHYTKAKRDLKNPNPLSAVLYHTENGYSLFDISRQISINISCGVSRKEKDIAFFLVHDTTDSLFALDVETNEGYLIHINKAGMTGMMRVDTEGNLLIETRNNDKTCWYIIRSDSFLSKLVSE